MLLHIALLSDWEAARQVGSYRVSTLGRDLDDVGFVHCSYPHQVLGTLSRFYDAVREPLVVLVIDSALLDARVVDEPPAPGAEDLFPHVYGPISVAAVRRTLAVTRGRDGSWQVHGLA